MRSSWIVEVVICALVIGCNNNKERRHALESNVTGTLPLTDMLVTVLPEVSQPQVLSIAGRPFDVQLNHIAVTLGSPPLEGESLSAWTVQVTGDDLVMGFGCSKQVTYSLNGSVLTITDSIDTVCDYSISFGPAAGHYTVNGNAVTLLPGRKYGINSDGQVTGM